MGSSCIAENMSPVHPAETAEEVSERLANYVGGAMACHMASIADELGVFRFLADAPPATAAEVAEGTQLHERWVREMLHQLAAARLVSTDAAAERFWLSGGQAATLAHETGPSASRFFLGGMVSGAIDCALGRGAAINGFRTGKGITYSENGARINCSTSRYLGVWTRHCLVDQLKTIPGLHAKLEAGIDVADIGCGHGIALATMAEAFPNSTFTGFDTCTHALAAARARTAHLSNAALKDPSQPGEELGVRHFNFMITLDAIHDMAHPAKVLAAGHAALKPDAVGWRIQDFNLGDTPADVIARKPEVGAILWGYSVSLCMSSALSEEGGAGLGTLGWSPPVATRMLKAAGFASVEQLDWESEMNAFYLAKL